MYKRAELHIEQKQNCKDKALQLCGRETGNSLWEKRMDYQSKTLKYLIWVWLVTVFTYLPSNVSFTSILYLKRRMGSKINGKQIIAVRCWGLCTYLDRYCKKKMPTNVLQRIIRSNQLCCETCSPWEKGELQSLVYQCNHVLQPVCQDMAMQSRLTGKI